MGGWTGNVRQKYIHSVGTVGKVEWIDMGGHPYTGIFQGASQGIARLSLAQEPSPPALNTAPGMGLKFLRDGVDSANLLPCLTLPARSPGTSLRIYSPPTS